MLTASGETTPAAVSVDRSGRRRRFIRAAVIAVGFGWAVVIALVVIGLAIPSNAPRPAFAGSTEFSNNPVACPKASKCDNVGCKRSAVARAPFASVQAAFDGHGRPA